MITVHHLENSRSQRVLWLLEELGLPYRVRRYARDPRTLRAPPELVAVHPLGKSPVITEDGTVVAETGAIVTYLTGKAGGALVPASGTEAHARYVYWLHYAEGSAMPPLLLKLVLGRLGWLGRPARPFVDSQLKLHLDYLDAELAKSEWFVGDRFTAADIMLSFPLEAAAQRAGVDATRPNLAACLRRIQARPAYRRALERGGPYAYA